MSGKLFLICAPSGAGKTTLVNKTLELLSDYPLGKVCTYTTKPIGKGEVPGKDYHFLTVPEFEERIQRGFFLEWSKDYDHYYGSPLSIKEELEHGTSLLLIVDRSGVRSILTLLPEALPIFITVSSLEVLKERLFCRARENNFIIMQRFEKAAAEIKDELESPLCVVTISNDDLDFAVRKLADFVCVSLRK